MTITKKTDMTREVPLPTPGEMLMEEWLTPLGITQYALAKALGVPPRRINEIVLGKRAITADTAVRLAAFFDTDAQSWMNLQTYYATEIARENIADQLEQIRAAGVRRNGDVHAPRQR
jgi:antitoxin HigA-1